ncbi:hypothetical protein JCM16303_003981 [Sporobolomyces ruberrimus]
MSQQASLTSVSLLGNEISRVIASEQLDMVKETIDENSRDSSLLDTSDNHQRLLLASPLYCNDRDQRFRVAAFCLLLEAGCDPEKVGENGLSIDAEARRLGREGQKGLRDWVENEVTEARRCRKRGKKYQMREQTKVWIERELKRIAGWREDERIRVERESRRRAVDEERYMTRVLRRLEGQEPEPSATLGSADDLPDYEEVVQANSPIIIEDTPSPTPSPKGFADDAPSPQGFADDAPSPRGFADDAPSPHGFPTDSSSPRGFPDDQPSPRGFAGDSSSPPPGSPMLVDTVDVPSPFPSSSHRPLAGPPPRPSPPLSSRSGRGFQSSSPSCSPEPHPSTKRRHARAADTSIPKTFSPYQRATERYGISRAFLASPPPKSDAARRSAEDSTQAPDPASVLPPLHSSSQILSRNSPQSNRRSSHSRSSSDSSIEIISEAPVSTLPSTQSSQATTPPSPGHARLLSNPSSVSQSVETIFTIDFTALPGFVDEAVLSHYLTFGPDAFDEIKDSELIPSLSVYVSLIETSSSSPRSPEDVPPVPVEVRVEKDITHNSDGSSSRKGSATYRSFEEVEKVMRIFWKATLLKSFENIPGSRIFDNCECRKREVITREGVLLSLSSPTPNSPTIARVAEKSLQPVPAPGADSVVVYFTRIPNFVSETTFYHFLFHGRSSFDSIACHQLFELDHLISSGQVPAPPPLPSTSSSENFDQTPIPYDVHLTSTSSINDLEGGEYKTGSATYWNATEGQKAYRLFNGRSMFRCLDDEGLRVFWN